MDEFYFCRGKSQIPSFTNLTPSKHPLQNALQKFKEYMLYEILELKDNRVNPPSVYIHSVDD